MKRPACASPSIPCPAISRITSLLGLLNRCLSSQLTAMTFITIGRAALSTVGLKPSYRVASIARIGITSTPLTLVVLGKAEIVFALLLDRRAGFLFLRQIITGSLSFGRRLSRRVLSKRAGSFFGLICFGHQNSPVFFFAGSRSGNTRGASALFSGASSWPCSLSELV